MLYVDIKYANMLSDKFERFKVKQTNPYLANFRCHICGDSKRNKAKARGYLYQRDDTIWFICHNCGIGHHLSEVLKLFDQSLFKQYISESYINKKDEKVEKTKKPVISAPILDGLEPISKLPPNHPTRQYVASRLIPDKWLEKLYSVDNFKAWVNSFIPQKFESEKNDETRLLIPFFDNKNSLIGIQGRSLNDESLNRYITIMLTESPKVFGWNEVDDSKFYPILEGPIDSMFVDNSIAMIGSSIPLSSLGLKEQNAIFVFDNEPRSKEIVNKISRKIKDGYRVTIFPADFKYKDINKAIQKGKTIVEVNKLIHQNTYQGLEAQLKLAAWKKV